MKIRLLVGGLFISCLLACSSGQREKPDGTIGPRTLPIEEDRYVRLVHVSIESGSDSEGDGSPSRPWRNLSYALEQIRTAGVAKRTAVLVAAGDYIGPTITMTPHVDLYGGFDAITWKRDIERHRTVLMNREGGRILIGADEARLDGFVLQRAKVRDKGAAVYCDGVSPIISNNVFYGNGTLAPQPWQPKYRHQTANDGGAIYGRNGAAPVIVHNLFSLNTTECGRGAAIALQGRCAGQIIGNLFFHNRTGTQDPMRSSDGGAVSVCEWSHPHIENNIFLHNRAVAANDAGALFVALWSSPVIKRNLLLGNLADDDAGALFVGGQEHRYDRPLDPLPAKDVFFVAIDSNVFMGNANPSKNSGAMRFTMESRGRFAHNLVVFNSGIYFQRCEAEIADNVILDHFLLAETKEGLQPCQIRRNLIWGEFRPLTPAAIYDNILQQPIAGNSCAAPIFVDDRQELNVLASAFHPHQATTHVLFGGKCPQPNQWRHRIVMAGDRWGVIKEHDQQTMQIWGDLSGCLEITILPSYTPKKK